MTKKEVFENYEEFIIQSYTRIPLVFVKGKGSFLIDIDGKKYLDFFPGWGVSNVGHCHPKVVSAVRDQIGKLIHVPNNFYHPQQGKLAKLIVQHSFPSKVFFANSGAEANEGAIKLSRIFGEGKRYEIITTINSFHGRTMGALTATGQAKHHVAFEPLMPGFKTVPYNDIPAIKAAITEKTVAVMLELVQGEGGVNIAEKSYIKELRQLCDEKNLLLIIDEVQTGFGRTGSLFAFQQYDIIPDIMTLAKGLGGGMPIGAVVAGKKVQDLFKPGMHGSTFGGSPVITKAAIGVFEAIMKDKMLSNAKTMGMFFLEELKKLQQQFSFIKEVRGKGLMLGLELTIEGKSIVDDCRENGLIINCTQGKVLRIMPALNVTKKHIKQAMNILEKSMKKQS